MAEQTTLSYENGYYGKENGVSHKLGMNPFLLWANTIERVCNIGAGFLFWWYEEIS